MLDKSRDMCSISGMTKNQIKQLVRDLGGSAELGNSLGLGKRAVDQWITRSRIPRPWLIYLKKQYPKHFLDVIM
jgi:hypothetical protein